MYEIVITNTWTPLVICITSLIAYVVYGKRYQFFVGCFIRIFIFIIHKIIPFVFLCLYYRGKNVPMQHYYMFFHTFSSVQPRKDGLE